MTTLTPTSFQLGRASLAAGALFCLSLAGVLRSGNGGGWWYHWHRRPADPPGRHRRTGNGADLPAGGRADVAVRTPRVERPRQVDRRSGGRLR